MHIYIYPHANLRAKAKKIDVIDKQLKNLSKDMFSTMYKHNGIGLAGNQIGVLKRIIVVDVPLDEERKEKNPIVLINPEIIESSKDLFSWEEGCLSMPGVTSKVDRPRKIKVKYQDLNGEFITLEAEDLLSTCIQHEIDHLNGVMFTDRISFLKKNMVLSKFKKLNASNKEE